MIRCTAAGRLTRDAEVFEYNHGESTGVKFSLACNAGRYRDEDTVFINCTYFNRDDRLAAHLLQGDQVIVSGDLNIRDSDDGKRYVDLVIDHFDFGAKKMR